jgi:hypothetical protein
MNKLLAAGSCVGDVKCWKQKVTLTTEAPSLDVRINACPKPICTPEAEHETEKLLQEVIIILQHPLSVPDTPVIYIYDMAMKFPEWYYYCAT